MPPILRELLASWEPPYGKMIVLPADTNEMPGLLLQSALETDTAPFWLFSFSLI